MTRAFLRNKKILSVLLLISFSVSFLPVFTQKTNAQVTQAASAAQGAAIVAAAKAVSVPTCKLLGHLVIGTGDVCDVGVRFNTLAMLSSTLGIGPGVAAKENIWDSIAYFMGRILVRQISQSIVDWINSGFNGNPSFVQNPEKFMTDTADRTIGEFIFASDLKALCSPFEINVRINLGLGYSPFKDQIKCRLSDVLQNTSGAVTQAYTDFMNGDFINGGGWDSWLNITTVPQNNQIGAMLIAQANLDAQIADKQLAKKDELNWSGGLLSMKNCVRTTKDTTGKVTKTENYSGDAAFHTVGTTETDARAKLTATGEWTGSTQDTCQIVTPGVWITGTGNKVLGMDLDRLGAADEINEIVGALANFVISEVMKKGMALVKKEDLSPDNPSWQAGISQLQSQQNGDVNSATSDSTYEPSYDSYTGLGETTTDDPQVNTTKESLQGRITTDQESEKSYHDAYSSVYSAASSTRALLLEAINSCTARLARTNISDRSDTRDSIAVASSSINLMENIQASSTPEIISSQSNLQDIQAISEQVDSAYDMNALNQQDTDLANLEQVLHTPDQIADAEEYASTTLSQIEIKNDQAIGFKNQCSR